YATASRSVQEFRYRIRATAVGRFAVPPVHAESMYLPSLYAQGASDGWLEVKPQP
ncbi:MAG: hypothetical protein KDI37_11260, partial [Xanthomonadales bacterium]|nr:hypothetical protein [Xanthomonadales bacterium]